MVGTNKAILYHLGFLPAVLIGILASVGGSILADILMGETPSTLVAGPPNAVAAAVGAMTHYCCYATGGLGNLDSTLCAVAMTFSLRFLGIRFGVSIPKPLRRRSLPDSLKRGQGQEIGPGGCRKPCHHLSPGHIRGMVCRGRHPMARPIGDVHHATVCGSRCTRTS